MSRSQPGDTSTVRMKSLMAGKSPGNLLKIGKLDSARVVKGSEGRFPSL